MTDHKDKMKENAIEFLMYSYFREVIKSKENIIKVAVEKAYGDATIRRAYNNNLATYRKENGDKDEEKNENNKKKSNKAKRLCLKYLVKDGKIGELIETDTQTAFNKKHDELCVELVKKHRDVKFAKYKEEEKKKGKYVLETEAACFTYGNAQKWVNMTMKNIYVICGALLITKPSEEITRFCEKISRKAEYFHIPIDSYILEAWKKVPSSEASYVKMSGESAYIKYNKINDESIALCTAQKPEYMDTWSSINCELYGLIRNNQSIQNNVSSNASEWPIEWESKTWIEIAEKRRKRRKRKG